MMVDATMAPRANRTLGGGAMAEDFKAEQVGSFLRPPGLLEARAA